MKTLEKYKLNLHNVQKYSSCVTFANGDHSTCDSQVQGASERLMNTDSVKE